MRHPPQANRALALFGGFLFHLPAIPRGNDFLGPMIKFATREDLGRGAASLATLNRSIHARNWVTSLSLYGLPAIAGHHWLVSLSVAKALAGLGNGRGVSRTTRVISFFEPAVRLIRPGNERLEPACLAYCR